MNSDERRDSPHGAAQAATRGGAPTTLRVGQHVDVRIDAVARDGRGAVKVGDRTLHVAATLPGDRGWVEVTALDRQGDRAHGALVALTEPGPGRRTPPCPQHEDVQSQGCTGCAWMPWTPHQQRVHLRALLASYDLHVDRVGWVGAGDGRSDDGACGYRWSAKRVAFEDDAGHLHLGSYRARSHHGAAMTGCFVDHPSIRDAADELEKVAQQVNIRAWRAGRRDANAAPGLRYVWFKTDGAAVLVTLITSGLDEATVRTLAAGLATPAGVAWSVQNDQGNAIRGAAPTPLTGAEALSVEIGGVPVSVGPLGFLQPNPAVAAQCYAELVRPDAADDGAPAAQRDALALDLYAGAGVTTALLRTRFATVIPCEAWPESAALLGVTPQTSATFLNEWLASDRASPDLVVANPPRAGMGAAVTTALRRLGPPWIHVMSCSPRSLQTDLAALAPDYELRSLRAWATLPQTPHVELVARLFRRLTP